MTQPRSRQGQRDRIAKQRLTYLTTLLTAAAFAIVGCNPRSALLRRVKDANSLLITNTTLTIGTTVTGTEVQAVLQAVKTAKKLPPNVEATPAMRVEFYKDGTRLATLDASAGIVWLDGKPYACTSNVLGSLYQRARVDSALRKH